MYGLGGGDGFAFVIQGEGPDAVGRSGNDLGYGGIKDSVAIEFDMYNVSLSVSARVFRSLTVAQKKAGFTIAPCL